MKLSCVQLLLLCDYYLGTCYVDRHTTVMKKNIDDLTFAKYVQDGAITNLGLRRLNWAKRQFNTAK